MMLILISEAISNSNAVIRQELRKRRFQMIDNNDDDLSWMQKKKGRIAAEVVNLGQHPLYVRSVRLFVPCSDGEGTTIRDFEPDASQRAQPIDPGAAVVFRGGIWDFSEHPLDAGDATESYCIVVESNKGFVAKSSGPSSVDMSFQVPPRNRKKAFPKSPQLR